MMEPARCLGSRHSVRPSRRRPWRQRHWQSGHASRPPGPGGAGVPGDLRGLSYRRLVVQLYGVTGDAAEAEDLVQEAFVRAAAAGRRFLKLDNHEAWLRTVAINIQRSRWRKLRNFSRIRDRLAAPPTDLPALEDRLDVIEALRGLPAGPA